MKPIKKIVDPVIVGRCMYGMVEGKARLQRTTRIVDVTNKDLVITVETKNTLYECSFTGFTLADTFVRTWKEYKHG